MNTATFRFTLGHLECVCLRDGTFTYPLASMFANVAPPQLEAVLRRHHLPIDHISTPYTCLLVTSDHHRVLIDTGAGTLGLHAATLFPSVDHATTVTGRLLGNLRALGRQPSEIDTIIITHAHPDHVGGTLDEAGQLVFANAHYFIAQAEWDFWLSEAAIAEAPPSMVDIARRNLTALHERVTLIKDGDEIVPGIQAIATPGHTPGHLALSIASAGQQLLHISDVVLHPLHLAYPQWRPVFDIAPEQAASSTQRIFDRAAAEQAVVFGHHLPPFPGLGYVRKRETGWQWQPLQQISSSRWGASSPPTGARVRAPVMLTAGPPGPVVATYRIPERCLCVHPTIMGDTYSISVNQ